MLTEYLENKVLPIWIVTFDQDLDRTYTYSRKDKVIASISTAIRDVLPSHPEADEAIDTIASDLVERLNEAYIPIVIEDSIIAVRRIELDKHHPIVSIMIECHDALSDDEHCIDILDGIESLFVDPI